jgi:salicylate hydroxylase
MPGTLEFDGELHGKDICCRGGNRVVSAPASLLKVHQEANVAIIGGGIGGFALALALQQRGIPCTVFERDEAFAEREQGYGLTMQQAQIALRALGFDRTMGLESFGIQSTRHVVHTAAGRQVGEWGLKKWGRPAGKKEPFRQNAHLPRQELRRMLMEKLHPEVVRWGHKLEGYEEVLPSSHDGANVTFGNVKLTFQKTNAQDGEVKVIHTASVMVGADGIRSAVRRQKIGDIASPLRYLGCIVILGIAESPVSPLTDGETVFQTADGTTRLYAMPFAAVGKETAGASTKRRLEQENNESSDSGNRSSSYQCSRGETMWQLSFPIPEEDARVLACTGSSALKEEALLRCSSWHAPIPQLLESTPNALISGYPAYDRAILSEEELRAGNFNAVFDREEDAICRIISRVTLIGDAAHPMSPFKVQSNFLPS